MKLIFLIREEKVPTYSWKSYLVVPPSYFFTILPRLLVLSCFFSSCSSSHPLPGLIALIVFGAVYFLTFIGFTLPIYLKLTKDSEWLYKEKCRQYLIRAFYSGIIGLSKIDCKV